MSNSAYEPKDILQLWWLGTPARPQHIGELSLVSGGRTVALQYAPGWLQGGFALSEDLPLTSALFVPPERDTAAGAVDDARPDRWGERVIRKFERSPRLSLLEFLLFAGDDRYGALGVSTHADAYRPWASAATPTLANLEEMAEVVRKVLANEPVPELQRRLVRPGVSLGGARPKSLISIDNQPWLVKFTEGEDLDRELLEHAAMTLAVRCGIDVAATKALRLASGGHAIAIRRFDRAGAMRVHAVSAHVALRAVGEQMGYPQLAQLLRRIVPVEAIASQQQQLYRRMVFNILIDNTDDHEKNHALLRRPDGSYLLAPAFDIAPCAQGLGYQAMLVGDHGAESTLENALTQARAFGLKDAAARQIIQEIATQLATWKAHFRRLRVSKSDLEMLSQFLDGDRLRAQRASFAAAARTPVAPRRGSR